MRAKTLKYLRCPNCGSGLSISNRSKVDYLGNIIEGELFCKKCKSTYIIREGVVLFE